jgi:hypothetical protein
MKSSASKRTEQSGRKQRTTDGALKPNRADEPSKPLGKEAGLVVVEGFNDRAAVWKAVRAQASQAGAA